jgi:hypothetical protein
VIDYYLVYRFIKLLTIPFIKWNAFKYGIIDENGNILKSRRDLSTDEERKSFTLFDLLILNIKKTLSKLPGGSTKIASYAAALYLLREGYFSENETLTESFVVELNYAELRESIRSVIEDATIAANNVSTGNVSGVGSDSQPFKSAWLKKRLTKTESTTIDFDKDAAKRLTVQKRHKKLVRPSIPLA